MTFQVFYRYIWNFGNVLERLRTGDIPPPNATDEAKARAVFQRIDFNNSGCIDHFELRMLLHEWNLSESDVQAFSRKLGNDREISFEVFFSELKPIWRFAYYDVIDKPLRKRGWYMHG